LLVRLLLTFPSRHRPFSQVDIFGEERVMKRERTLKAVHKTKGNQHKLLLSEGAQRSISRAKEEE